MKTVIITGAGGNLGRAVVKKFLESGYRVIAADAHVSSSNTGNPNFESAQVDLSNESEAKAFIDSCFSKYKTIYAGLLLVGGFTMGNVESTSEEDLKKQFALNFETAYNVARPLFTHMMKNNHGRLIFVAARPALDSSAGKNMIAYALSKSLIFKFAELLNASAKGKNVSATVFVPSTIDTPQNRASMPDANPENWVKASQIAELMEMICSESGAPLRESVLKVYNNA
ncbi:MAG: SDR family NAD(P)-dependent oxidoreductase [Chitinophagales bacterium]